MKINNPLYLKTRKAWRAWLIKNYKKKHEVWLIYYRKGTGKPRIEYNDAVEEALCYGWIDSTIKKIDNERFAQRFTPRRNTSVLSQANRERLLKLIANKKMTKAGLAAVAHVFNPTKEKLAEFKIAPDILKPLQANQDAWKYFQKFPEVYKRTRIGYLESRRRHGQDLFNKSLDYFIKKTANNKKFGFVKI
ncbi:MAG: hypothetical protein A2252_02920 [Elusimicrobia bacterium RIFOXYA2_FULL_39_19]|nr:MAG: hypothetical protein A2252_02920 [Elusimicrobia bacterium RIFOXYA2_FULL_39_19]